MKILLTRCCLFIGLVLILINIIGLFKSMRNKAIFKNDETFFINDITIRLNALDDAIQKMDDETDRDFALRMNEMVHNAIAHYWNENAAKKYYGTVPIWENYILYFFHFFKPESFTLYEFCNYEKALERGIGLCSQHAIILSEILREQGIQAQIVHLGGHIVVRVEVEKNIWHIFDPDYGIAIPKDIFTIEQNPENIKKYYYPAIQNIRKPKKKILSHLVSIYGKKDNRLFRNGMRDYLPRMYVVELLSYSAIWIIPVIFMIPALIVLLKKGRI
ncbi:MAG: hypothetical protein GF384_05030 [Elusimicrobia bacterium]|nr:hypothetical protein [Elusimicrobiota bacterium]MBD3412155.1 hypothetical protein [Elusimicrobiota bacterium]